MRWPANAYVSVYNESMHEALEFKLPIEPTKSRRRSPLAAVIQIGPALMARGRAA